jgi:outer membrane protein OmpA-like peptidoglycan-associated protein
MAFSPLKNSGMTALALLLALQARPAAAQYYEYRPQKPSVEVDMGALGGEANETRQTPPLRLQPPAPPAPSPPREEAKPVPVVAPPPAPKPKPEPKPVSRPVPAPEEPSPKPMTKPFFTAPQEEPKAEAPPPPPPAPKPVVTEAPKEEPPALPPEKPVFKEEKQESKKEEPPTPPPAKPEAAAPVATPEQKPMVLPGPEERKAGTPRPRNEPPEMPMLWKDGGEAPPPAADSATVDITLSFEIKASEVSAPELQKQLDDVAARLAADTSTRLQVRAYASGEDGNKGSARLISFSRALSVRQYLMSKGVAPNRIDVRALGAGTDKKPLDRVDLAFVK